jgi:rubrerythrin
VESDVEESRADVERRLQWERTRNWHRAFCASEVVPFGKTKWRCPGCGTTMEKP